MKDLYSKNFKSLKKEVEEDIRRWKDLLCSWTGRINILKGSIFPKVITDFMQSIKSPTQFFIDCERTIFTVIKKKKQVSSKQFYSVREHLETHQISTFQAVNRAILIKSV